MILSIKEDRQGGGTSKLRRMVVFFAIIFHCENYEPRLTSVSTTIITMINIIMIIHSNNNDMYNNNQNDK